nr:PREDICTED: rho GDP-dissociation inhibitor 2 [Equus przewalskii]
MTEKAPEPHLEEDDDELDGKLNYKPPPQKSLKELQEMDKDDESLTKYKKTLLGDGPVVADPTAPNVTVTRLTLVCESAPGPITMDLTGDLEALKKETFVLKEGVEYRVKIHFKVNKDSLLAGSMREGELNSILWTIEKEEMITCIFKRYSNKKNFKEKNDAPGTSDVWSDLETVAPGFVHCKLCSKFSRLQCLFFLSQTLTRMNFSFFLVDKATFMVGSYGPRPEEYEFLTPTEEAPKGMLARGTYHNKSFFTDDDKHDHLTWEWNLSIKKEWTE